MLVARKALPANDLKEFIAWLKLNPDKSSMGTVGAGSSPQILPRRRVGVRRPSAKSLEKPRVYCHDAELSCCPQCRRCTAGEKINYRPLGRTSSDRVSPAEVIRRAL